MAAARAYRTPRKQGDRHRLSMWLASEVEREAKRLGLTPSALMRRVWRHARATIRAMPAA